MDKVAELVTGWRAKARDAYADAAAETDQLERDRLDREGLFFELLAEMVEADGMAETVLTLKSAALTAELETGIKIEL